MRRSFDPAPFNRILNDPSVRPWMGRGIGPLDLTATVRNPDNICLLTACGEGGYLLERAQPGLYIAHTLALPSARGKPMLELMRDGFAHLFLEADAVEVTSFVPDGNRAAERWAEVAGFRKTFRREAFFDVSGELVGGQFYSLSYADWVPRHGDNHEAGERFHQQIHDVSPSLGTHPDDPIHDAFVGATILGIVAGNVHKAINLFNRWAAQAMYQPATVISEHPVIIETGDAILGMVGGEMQIMEVKTLAQSENAR